MGERNTEFDAGMTDNVRDRTQSVIEEGRRLASRRDDLIAQGVAPDDLLIVRAPIPACRYCGSTDPACLDALAGDGCCDGCKSTATTTHDGRVTSPEGGAS